MKKILSVLMSFFTLFLMPIGKVNSMQNQAEENQINILVVCQDDYILNQFCNYINELKYIPTSNEVVKHQALSKHAFIDDDGIVKQVFLYQVPFTKLSSERINSILSKLENSIQVIILYDISDCSLDSLVDRYSEIESEKWQNLLNIDTFLNNCINASMAESIKPNWFNSFNFFSYDKSGLLTPEERERRRDALNFYTCSLEHKLEIDNRWGRGHADYLRCSKSFFGSFYGNIYTFDCFKTTKKKNHITTRRTKEMGRLPTSMNTNEATPLNRQQNRTSWLIELITLQYCKKSESEQEYLQ